MKHHTATRWALTAVALLVLGACAGEPARYDSAEDVAAALAAGGVTCTGVAGRPEGSLVRSQATCESDGGDLGLYVFDGAEQRDRWLQVGARLGAVAVGPNWVVTGAREVTQGAATALNGRFAAPE